MGISTIEVIDKSRNDYGLLKVPDSILLKEARQEIGALKAYIEELEDRLKNPIEILTPEEEKYKKKFEKKCEIIIQLQKENARLQKEIGGEELKEYVKMVKEQSLYKEMQAQVKNCKEKISDLTTRLNRIHQVLREYHLCKVVVFDNEYNIISKEPLND